ncbi:hypothetical protein D3C83_334800 [compost metagenome]
MTFQNVEKTQGTVRCGRETAPDARAFSLEIPVKRGRTAEKVPEIISARMPASVTTLMTSLLTMN